MTGEPVTRPMTMEERVEAGAAAAYGKNWNSADQDKRPGERMKEIWRDIARRVLNGAFPELFNGTGWIAPMTLTPAMTDEMERAWGTAEDQWQAAAQAYLKEGK